MKKVLLILGPLLLISLLALYFFTLKGIIIQNDLINTLKGSGIKVEALGAHKSTELYQQSIIAYAYKLNNRESLTAFRFSSSSSAKSAFKYKIFIDSFDIPHFYIKDRLIFIYIGHDKTVLNILTKNLIEEGY